MTPRRLLIVEDDPLVRDACTEFFEDLGYATVGVDDAARALDEIASRPPDLILLDLLMPRARLDGVGFLFRAATGSAVDIPIVILSGLADAVADQIPPHVAHALRIVAIVPKPIDFEVLAREIDRGFSTPAA